MAKKNILLISAALLIWHSSGYSAEPATENEKILYSLGYELGRDLKRERLELAPEMLLQGVQDALSGHRPQVNARQRQQALKEIKRQRAEANLAKAQAYLAANAEKEGVVSLPSGLQYREIKAGAGRSPEPDDSVVVHYRGRLIDDVEFDSSYQRGRPSTFQLKRVIKGWREALPLMKEGAHWELFIPPDLGYGKRGHSKTIAPNSALIYDVELISVK